MKALVKAESAVGLELQDIEVPELHSCLLYTSDAADEL